jgi:hypothetical protein
MISMGDILPAGFGSAAVEVAAGVPASDAFAAALARIISMGDSLAAGFCSPPGAALIAGALGFSAGACFSPFAGAAGAVTCRKYGNAMS